MDEFFASRPATNSKHLCVGALTRAEAAEAAEAGLGTGWGYYLFVAEGDNPSTPIELLGRLASEDAAREFCALLGMQRGSVAG